MDLTHLQITCSKAARAANRPKGINTTAASSGKWPGPAATRLHARGRVVIIRGPRLRPRDLSGRRWRRRSRPPAGA